MIKSTSARPGKKIRKEEVALLFLKVVLFENSNKGVGGADPFLPHSTTHSLHACRASFVDPVQGSNFASATTSESNIATTHRLCPTTTLARLRRHV